MVRHLQVNYVGALHVIDAVLPALLRAGQRPLSAWWQRGGYRGLPQRWPTGRPRPRCSTWPRRCTWTCGRGHRRVGGQPGLRRHAADRSNRLRDAGAAHAGPGAAHILRGWARGRSRSTFRGASHSGSSCCGCCRTACTSPPCAGRRELEHARRLALQEWPTRPLHPCRRHHTMPPSVAVFGGLSVGSRAHAFAVRMSASGRQFQFS